MSFCYCGLPDENIRSAIGLTYRAVAQHNQDILINYMDKVVPLTFFAMHKKKTPGMASDLFVTTPSLFWHLEIKLKTKSLFMCF